MGWLCWSGVGKVAWGGEFRSGGEAEKEVGGYKAGGAAERGLSLKLNGYVESVDSSCWLEPKNVVFSIRSTEIEKVFWSKI